jgi:hypothetical protein
MCGVGKLRCEKLKERKIKNKIKMRSEKIKLGQ